MQKPSHGKQAQETKETSPGCWWSGNYMTIFPGLLNGNNSWPGACFEIGRKNPWFHCRWWSNASCLANAPIWTPLGRLSKKSAPEKRAAENKGLFSRKFVQSGVFRQSR